MVMGDLVVEVDVAVVVAATARLGSACLFEGCIPSKALLHVAAVLDEAERVREFGVDFGAPRVALDPLRTWKAERVVGKLARGLAAVAKAKGGGRAAGPGVFGAPRGPRVGAGAPEKTRFKHAPAPPAPPPGPPPGRGAEP